MSAPDHGTRTIGEGDVVPDVALFDHTGDTWRFTDHRGTPILAILHRHLA